MEGLLYDIHTKPGELHNFTIYSVLHQDARAADKRRMYEHMDKRAALPNSHFLGIGDFGNFIMGFDPRMIASVSDMDPEEQDEYIDNVVRVQYERFRGYPWRMIGIGNHCTAVIKRYHTNPMKRLAERIGEYQKEHGEAACQYAGYSGYARFRFHLGSGTGAKTTFTILYHHGKWGGKNKGIIGAQHWSSFYDGWDVMAYGHNHATHAHHETRLSMNQNGKLVDRDVAIVNTGTFLRGATQGGTPEYSEIAAYPPVALACPLLKVIPGTHGVKWSIELGEC